MVLDRFTLKIQCNISDCSFISLLLAMMPLFRITRPVVWCKDLCDPACSLPTVTEAAGTAVRVLVLYANDNREAIRLSATDCGVVQQHC